MGHSEALRSRDPEHLLPVDIIETCINLLLNVYMTYLITFEFFQKLAEILPIPVIYF